MRGVFVTGTDTNVGKTVVSAWACKSWGLSYWKPVQTGCEEDDDTATVARLAGCPTHAPRWRLKAPLAPLPAAELEGQVIRLEDFTLPEGPVLVEGAGGILVPLTATAMMTDLMARLGLPVLVAARSGLGTINHTLLTLEALRARALPILGVVLVGPPNAGNRQAIEQFGKVQVLGELPPLSPLDLTGLPPLEKP